MSHLLFAVCGSAGDVFPTIAVAGEAKARGHRATVLGPRASGLYARVAGIDAIAFGKGSEVKVVGDESFHTLRFDGFDSWRRISTAYHRIVADSYARARSVVGGLDVDLMVVHPLAPFGSLIATELGLPWATLHLCPQLSPVGRPTRPGRFGGPFADWIHAQEQRLGLEPVGQPLLRWGWADTNLSVHDPALVARTPLASMPIGEPLGFPAWDALPMRADDAAALERARALGEPYVLVSLGSFIGHRRVAFWRELAEALARLHWPTLALGVPPALRPDLERTGMIICAGHVPLSLAMANARLVVHHGGIGTTYTALRAGKVAAVVPQAYDQGFNARLVDTAGCGVIVGPGTDLPGVLRALAEDGERHDRTAALAAALIPPATATAAITDRLLTLTSKTTVNEASRNPQMQRTPT